MRSPSRCTSLTVGCRPQTNVHLQHCYLFVSHQCFSHLWAFATQCKRWTTGTLPTSCWVRGQGEVVLVSDPKFHYVYFLKVESGVRSYQKRLWKHKTILSLLPFFISPVVAIWYSAETVCVPLWFLYSFLAVKVYRESEKKPKTQQLLVKCQSRMIQAVVVHQRFLFSCTEMVYCSKSSRNIKYRWCFKINNISRYIKEGKKWSKKGKKVRKVVYSLRTFSTTLKHVWNAF